MNRLIEKTIIAVCICCCSFLVMVGFATVIVASFKQSEGSFIYEF